MLFVLLACQPTDTPDPAPADTAEAADTATDTDTDTGADTDSSGTTDDTGTPAEATFDRDVVPILEVKCAGCHYSEPQGLRLYGDGVYDLLVGHQAGQLRSMDRVTPGDLDQSYLWHKLNGTHEEVGGTGSAMPTVYGEPLTAAELDTFRAWILGGALR